MTVAITGWRSKITEEFRAMLPARGEAVPADWAGTDFPYDATRYLFCHGLLFPKRAEDQTQDERDASWFSNYISVATLCDGILARNSRARICIIGSESAYRGSFDGSYAEAKASLHLYIESVRTRSAQQIVGISPWIIGDAGMTTRRADTGNLRRKREAHPMRRFVTSREVAALAHHLLYEQPYISGTVIRMHGGLK